MGLAAPQIAIDAGPVPEIPVRTHEVVVAISITVRWAALVLHTGQIQGDIHARLAQSSSLELRIVGGHKTRALLEDAIGQLAVAVSGGTGGALIPVTLHGPMLCGA